MGSLGRRLCTTPKGLCCPNHLVVSLYQALTFDSRQLQGHRGTSFPEGQKADFPIENAATRRGTFQVQREGTCQGLRFRSEDARLQLGRQKRAFYPQTTCNPLVFSLLYHHLPQYEGRATCATCSLCGNPLKSWAQVQGLDSSV